MKREYLKKHLKLIHNVTDADYNVYERIDEENKTKKPWVYNVLFQWKTFEQMLFLEHFCWELMQSEVSIQDEYSFTVYSKRQ